MNSTSYKIMNGKVYDMFLSIEYDDCFDFFNFMLERKNNLISDYADLDLTDSGRIEKTKLVFSASSMNDMDYNDFKIWNDKIDDIILDFKDGQIILKTLQDAYSFDSQNALTIAKTLDQALNN